MNEMNKFNKDITFEDDQELFVYITGVQWDSITDDDEYPPCDESTVQFVSFCAEDFGEGVISTVEDTSTGVKTRTINEEDILDYAMQWLSDMSGFCVLGIENMEVKIASPVVPIRLSYRKDGSSRQ